VSRMQGADMSCIDAHSIQGLAGDCGFAWLSAIGWINEVLFLLFWKNITQGKGVHRSYTGLAHNCSRLCYRGVETQVISRVRSALALRSSSFCAQELEAVSLEICCCASDFSLWLSPPLRQFWTWSKNETICLAVF
jgi:hypothetical protein